MNSHTGAVRDQLDRLFQGGTVAGLDEGALLERYVTARDEAAFAALVARHGPMVLGVCRRVLRDERDVEDAFQATFLVLVRRAGAIRDGDLVGRWLHGVAHRVAVRARAHSARRFVREQATSVSIEPAAFASGPADLERRELLSIVDEEVTRLPSALREPVVLCYLEGMTHDEAARRLRWPVGTVRSRMARARDVLRRRLARRGLAADGAALSAALIRLPVPPEWVDATVRSSWSFATSPATAAAASLATARPAAIARRILLTMTFTKLSYLGTLGLGLGLAVGGYSALAVVPQDSKPPASSATTAAENSVPPTSAGSRSSRSEDRPGPTPLSVGEELDSAVKQLARVQDSLRKPINARDRASEVAASEMVKVGDELDRAVKQLAVVTYHLRKLDVELDRIRSDQRTATARPRDPAADNRNSTRQSAAPVPATSAGASPPAARLTSPSAAGKKAGADRTPKPHYISIGIHYLVISADGSKAGIYNPATGKSRPVRLPPILGDRREFIFTQWDNGFLVNRSDGQWLVALELDRDHKVTRIAALNVLEDQSWIAIDIPEPVERSSIQVAGNSIFTIGTRVYGFSSAAKRWDILDVAPGTRVGRMGTSGAVSVQKDDRLFVFNPHTGRWDDIYAKAIEGAADESGK